MTRCAPALAIALLFTASIPPASAALRLFFSPTGAGELEDLNPALLPVPRTNPIVGDGQRLYLWAEMLDAPALQRWNGIGVDITIDGGRATAAHNYNYSNIEVGTGEVLFRRWQGARNPIIEADGSVRRVNVTAVTTGHGVSNWLEASLLDRHSEFYWLGSRTLPGAVLLGAYDFALNPGESSANVYLWVNDRGIVRSGSPIGEPIYLGVGDEDAGLTGASFIQSSPLPDAVINPEPSTALCFGIALLLFGRARRGRAHAPAVRMRNTSRCRTPAIVSGATAAALLLSLAPADASAAALRLFFSPFGAVEGHPVALAGLPVARENPVVPDRSRLYLWAEMLGTPATQQWSAVSFDIVPTGATLTDSRFYNWIERDPDFGTIAYRRWRNIEPGDIGNDGALRRVSLFTTSGSSGVTNAIAAQWFDLQSEVSLLDSRVLPRATLLGFIDVQLLAGSTRGELRLEVGEGTISRGTGPPEPVYFGVGDEDAGLTGASFFQGSPLADAIVVPEPTALALLLLAALALRNSARYG
ncbi:MAG: hypothetical protein HRU75_05975 [Planctomycetia bacterium]|nr:MAG: hypothetical protein HRU75_05975 [Planctomycetia bacterium]